MHTTIPHFERRSAVSRFMRAFLAIVVRERPAFWLVRLYYGCSILVTSSIAFFLDNSVQREIFDNNGIAGWALLFTVAGGGGMILLDVIVNDLFPDRFCSHWCVARRHQVYMVIAIALGSIIFINVQQGANFALTMRYGLDATFAVAIATLDLGARLADVRRKGTDGHA